MKKKFSILLLFAAVAATAVVNPLSWKTTSLELGQLKVNEATAVQFEFTNSSDQAVTILEAKGSCGCTIVETPKAAIEPGESAFIEAVFKSGKPGVFRKSIVVKTSASSEDTYLYFTGEVVE